MLFDWYCRTTSMNAWMTFPWLNSAGILRAKNGISLWKKSWTKSLRPSCTIDCHDRRLAASLVDLIWSHLTSGCSIAFWNRCAKYLYMWHWDGSLNWSLKDGTTVGLCISQNLFWNKIKALVGWKEIRGPEKLDTDIWKLLPRQQLSLPVAET